MSHQPPTRRPAPANATSGSATITSDSTEPSTQDPSHSEQPSGVLRLYGDPENQGSSRTTSRIHWSEDVVDNSDMGKKSSKVCCIYHKPRKSGESSSEDSSDSSSDDDDSDAANDDGAARPSGRPQGNRDSHHHHAHGKHKKRKPSPNAYEKQPATSGNKPPTAKE